MSDEDLYDAAILEVVDNACLRGAPVGCELASVIVLNNFTGPSDDRILDAVPHLERGCRFGSARSCATVGALMLKGIGMEIDEARGISMLRYACSKDDGDGCFYLATYFQQTRDAEAAVPMLVRSCELGLHRGCQLAGKAYANGEGVAADRDRALTLLDAACKLSSKSRACAERDDVAERVYPLVSVSVHELVFSHTGARRAFSHRRSKAQAKRLADRASTALVRGEDIDMVALRYKADSSFDTLRTHYRRNLPADADPDRVVRHDRLLQLPPGSTFMQHEPDRGYVVYFRPN